VNFRHADNRLWVWREFRASQSHQNWHSLDDW